MASERDLELLDDYISNRLSAEDKASFEQKLDADPALKSEYQLQQRIAESLRQARTLELKTMLKNVPVSALHGGGSSIAGKVVLWIAATVAVGTALYLYLKPETSPVEPVRQEVTQDSATSSAPAEAPSQDEQTPAAEENQDQKAPEKEKLADTPQQSSPASRKNDTVEKVVERPAIEAFNPSEEVTENTASKTEATEGTAKAAKEVSIPVQTDNSNKKYNFHYQIRDGKLYLYGPFENNLYEIMEFFTENKRTIFLFHQNNYYLLNEDVKVKPLTAINDPVLLKKLKEYRGK